jgi:hypothetical protein
MTKLTNDELSRINLIKQDALDIAATLGELEFERISIELKIENQKENVKNLKKREAEMLDEIKSKYGNVTINIETGEIS